MKSSQRRSSYKKRDTELLAETKLFPVVAIGASAGGLEAFTQLIRGLPNNTGMAFVFVQHLDPTHHSLLAELPVSLSERQSGIFGLLYALGSIVTLLMMCDRRDLGTAVGERPPSAATEINW